MTVSISTEDIFSLMALSIRTNPTLNWFSTNSPTDLTLLFPKWSMSSVSSLPSLRRSIFSTILSMSSLVKTVFFISTSKSNLLFNFTLPTSDKS